MTLLRRFYWLVYFTWNGTGIGPAWQLSDYMTGGWDS